MKMRLKLSSAKWRPFCPGEAELTELQYNDFRWHDDAGRKHGKDGGGPGQLFHHEHWTQLQCKSS